MRLIIDFGNTLKKLAIFKKNELIYERSSPVLTLNQLEELNKSYPDIRQSIICSVVEYPAELDLFLSKHYHHLRMGAHLKFPFHNHYKQPTRLGMDRAAAVAAASHLFPGENVLVIDAGTCITMDILADGKDYHGGIITPGIRLRFRALNQFTDRLPLIQDISDADLVGDTTQASIKSGVLNGVVAEIDGMIDRYRHTFRDLKVIMSGGDYNYFDKRLKNNIFAIPNIVLLGLNIILEFNDN